MKNSKQAMWTVAVWCGLPVLGALLVNWGCTGGPIVIPTPTPSGSPTPSPTPSPTASPTPSPSPTPSESPTPSPSTSPSPSPSASPSPSPTPTSRPCPVLSCANDSDCADGVFCNGSETCDTLTQSCICTDAPCDPDTEECDEELDECMTIAEPGCLSDDDCEPNEFCNLTSGQCLPDFTASCGPGAGVCSLANSTPGCQNPECCEVVCALMPSCCLSQWTQDCAELTFSFTTCLVP